MLHEPCNEHEGSSSLQSAGMSENFLELPVQTWVCVCAVGDQVKNIQVPESDLDIQTMRASGAGGQHVNKTESAVRVRHIPSGLSVRIEDNRSQLMNKVHCMLS